MFVWSCIDMKVKSRYSNLRLALFHKFSHLTRPTEHFSTSHIYFVSTNGSNDCVFKDNSHSTRPPIDHPSITISGLVIQHDPENASSPGMILHLLPLCFRVQICYWLLYVEFHLNLCITGIMVVACHAIYYYWRRFFGSTYYVLPWTHMASQFRRTWSSPQSPSVLIPSE